MQFTTKEDYQKHIEAINQITSYIDYFSDSSNDFGGCSSDTSTLPYITYSSKVESFIQDLHILGFIIEFDWTAWDKPKDVFENPQLIRSFEFKELEQLLTTIIRKERFSEGTLMSAINNGIILRILEQYRFLTNPEGDLLSQEIDDENENSMMFFKEFEKEEDQEILNKIDNSDLIELNEFYITGLEYYEAKNIDFSDIKIFSLQLEPENDYDINAIEIYYHGKKIGYVPKEENALIAKMMKQGVDIVAKISNYDKEALLQKRVKVILYQDTL